MESVNGNAGEPAENTVAMKEIAAFESAILTDLEHLSEIVAPRARPRTIHDCAELIAVSTFDFVTTPIDAIVDGLTARTSKNRGRRPHPRGGPLPG
ncbi:hypothetical protein [Virgisporangium aurantiacum]|uniref:Uncharacterized protein n=1 Tax=Virgisporangium aurantiacum TaxID=175570 RepID=A0A8J3Z129_9ACTN|nr:hypothetical protein [Virgisporangium aurantiacum]GIJ54348.1 hypothetical protein Vau01_018640 [Virgisporangium aurantiacum]